MAEASERDRENDDAIKTQYHETKVWIWDCYTPSFLFFFASASLARLSISLWRWNLLSLYTCSSPFFLVLLSVGWLFQFCFPSESILQRKNGEWGDVWNVSDYYFVRVLNNYNICGFSSLHSLVVDFTGEFVLACYIAQFALCNYVIINY